MDISAAGDAPTSDAMFPTASTGSAASSGRQQDESYRELYTDEEMYAIQLRKDAHFPIYGFGYRAISATDMVLTGILPGTPIDAWNETCQIDQVACVADTILSVNGSTGPRAMVEELQFSDEVTIILAKTGPRWHIKGVVGECLEKITTAKERGVDLILDDEQDENVYQGKQTVSSEIDDVEESGMLESAPMIICGAVFPTFCLLLFFSQIFGVGTGIYGMFAEEKYNLFGNFLIFLSCCVAILFFVLDIRQWKSGRHKSFAIFIAVFLHLLGWLFKSKWYPSVPLVYLNMMIPLLLGVLKGTALKGVKSKIFYTTSSITFMSVAAAVLVLWLLWMFAGDNAWNDANKLKYAEQAKPIYDSMQIKINGEKRHLDYMWDCHPQKRQDYEILDINLKDRISTNYQLNSEEREERLKKCSQVATTWFLSYMVPFISILVNAIYGAFCYANGVLIDFSKPEKIEKALKRFCLTVACVCIIMWISASVAGATVRLGMTIMSFGAAGNVLLFIWVYNEFGGRAIKSAVVSSPTFQMVLGVAMSNPFRGFVLLIGGLAVPVTIFAVMLNQRARVLRGYSRTKFACTIMANLPDYALKICHLLKQWHWPGILLWSNIWSIAYFTITVLVMRMTYVFLAWLNGVLATWPFGVVLIAFFLIGFTMFLLPPVPGVPVYITGGIIISYQTRDVPSLGGFWGGILIACVLVVAIKIAAVCGQYAIGYFMYNSLTVRANVGVDKVAIRGVEKILQKRGLSLPKVSVLVGGPDWPTSVLCGLLRLNLAQCCLGTLPVFFVSSPCVIAGAFLSGPGGDDDMSEFYSTMSTSIAVIASMLQSASFLVALYYIQDTVFRYHDELSTPRPEDEPVRERSAREAQLQHIYQEATHWSLLTTMEKATCLTSTILLTMSFYMFALMDKSCWRAFSLRNKIEDPYEEGGLNGEWYTIILPLGMLACGLFFLGVCFDQIYRKRANQKANRLMEKLDAEKQELVEASEARKSARTSRGENIDQRSSGFKVEAQV